MPYIIAAEEFTIEQRGRITTYYNTNRLKLKGFETKQSNASIQQERDLTPLNQSSQQSE